MLNGPTGIAFDANDDLYVVDSLNNRVQGVYQRRGDFLTDVGHSRRFRRASSTGPGASLSTGKGPYTSPIGATTGCRSSARTGNISWRSARQNGSGSSLNHPAGVAVDSDGDVYVTDWGNRRVQIYEQDGEVLAGLYGDMRDHSKAAQYVLARDPDTIKRMNREEAPFKYLNKFSRPVGIDIDEHDRIFVTDALSRVVVYQQGPRRTKSRRCKVLQP